jgi:hypothetical protein
MIPHEQAVIADALEARGMSRDDAVQVAGEIIERLRAEGYIITEQRPGA